MVDKPNEHWRAKEIREVGEKSLLTKMPPVPNIVIAVDFDGTIVKHRFPEIGEIIFDLAGLSSLWWLKNFQQAGASLILYTMRDKEYLDAAINLCELEGVKFHSCQVNPTQGEWTTSPKCYAHLYIDDAAVGCPLVYPQHPLNCSAWDKTIAVYQPNPRNCDCGVGSERPWADWDNIGPMVLERIEEFNRLREEHHQIYVRTS